MDAGEDHFPVSAVEESSDLSVHLLRSKAAAPASGVRDNAVCAKGVASVLNFQKGPGTFGMHVMDRQSPKVIAGSRISNGYARMVQGARLSQPVHKIQFLQVSQNVGCKLFCSNKIRLELGVTPGRHNEGIGRSALRPPQKLPGLKACLGCNRTAVYNVDVGALPKRRQAVSGLAKAFQDIGRFILVDFAAQGFQGR
jgi:hypothetical protein